MPGDAAFQSRVLRATLELLEVAEGPIIVDYDEDAAAAPVTDEEAEGWACPVNFGNPKNDEETGVAAALQREILDLTPWHDLSVERRGRTTVGVSGFEMEEAGRYVTSFLDDPPAESPHEGLTMGDVLKLACDDLKAFYFEAVTARPGDVGREQLDNWFWSETELARVFMALKPICLASDDHTMRGMGLHTLVPRNVTGAWNDPDI